MRSPATSTRHIKRPAIYLLLLYAALIVSCTVDQKRSGLPTQAQTAIDSIGEDLDQQRYEKIYNEAAEEWRSANTPEQSEAVFKTLREKLGGVRTRDYQTAREEQSSSGPLSGHSLVVTYYTTFERGAGMETFTLVERQGQWQLARYFVNSNALKQ
ncbi:MAG TPA: DUF4019 domain-containing protein [Pyrinomonadaceae bacterium]|jgi:hypothetical protein|nr:DUF4019 domain-containing protein [Pyrinomonadaceae bacterium]